MNKKFIMFSAVLSVLFLTGCVGTTKTIKDGDKLTVAKVQREIKVGMSSSDVVEVLGTPNMVTTDDARRETWVYDRISTQVDSSGSSSGVWLLIVGASGNKSSTTSSQRTLTIIVKFDENSKVRDFSYRTSSF